MIPLDSGSGIFLRKPGDAPTEIGALPLPLIFSPKARIV